MIDMKLHTFLVLLHIVSTALGVGGATVCDYLFLKTIHQNTIQRSEYVFLKLITNIVMVGLGILLVSGAGFLVLYISEKPEALMNPKIWAKVTIVAILTVNGWVMHAKILPLFKERIGKKLLNENVLSRTKLLLGAAKQ